MTGADSGLDNSSSPHFSCSFLKIPSFALIPRNNDDQEGNKCYDV